MQLPTYRDPQLTPEVGIPTTKCSITQKHWSSTESTAFQALETTPAKDTHSFVGHCPRPVHSEGLWVWDCEAK